MSRRVLGQGFEERVDWEGIGVLASLGSLLFFFFVLEF